MIGRIRHITKTKNVVSSIGSQRGPAIQVDKRTFYPIPTVVINILLEEEATLIQEKRAFWGFWQRFCPYDWI